MAVTVNKIRYGRYTPIALYYGEIPIKEMYCGEELVWLDEPSFFYFENIESTEMTVRINVQDTTLNNSFSFSEDGEEWTEAALTSSFTVAPNSKKYIKGTFDNGNGRMYFRGNKEHNVGGDVLSLIHGDNFDTTEEMLKDNQFTYLFDSNTKLKSAEKLILRSNKMTNGCYNNMFYYCTGLVTPPELPATKLGNGCYKCMFQECESMSSAPALPATTLTSQCYYYMFSGCLALTTAPILNAIDLGTSCYYGMFCRCESLENVQEILPATELTVACYGEMFKECRALKVGPALPAASGITNCYYEMFNRCTSIESVTCLLEGEHETAWTNRWLEYAPSTGTFTKKTATQWGTSFSEIPEGWTIVNV